MKIVRADTLGYDTLDIQFDNGHTVLLDIRPMLKQPEYAMLLDGKFLPKPRTDGHSVYWSGGPRLSVEEIMKMIANSKKKENNKE